MKKTVRIGLKKFRNSEAASQVTRKDVERGYAQWRRLFFLHHRTVVANLVQAQKKYLQNVGIRGSGTLPNEGGKGRPLSRSLLAKWISARQEGGRSRILTELK